MTEPQFETRHVSMSNQLARAAHGLNLSEKRLVALGLAGTDSKAQDRLVQAQQNNAGWKVVVTAKDYAEAFDVSKPEAYTQLKAAAYKLFEREIVYEVKDKRGNMRGETARWISSRGYADKEGYVTLNFSPEIAPHLLGLRKHFTTYQLRRAVTLESVYAWRLFEVLQSWLSTGVYKTDIEDFWDVMEAPPSCRADFKGLRLRIIEPSVQALQDKAGMLVKWEPVRLGSRRVTSLVFRFSMNPQAQLDLGDPQPPPL